jgi:hypothetical protein
MVEDTVITMVEREFKGKKHNTRSKEKKKQTQYWNMRERLDGKAERVRDHF